LDVEIEGKGEPLVALDMYVCATCGYAELHDRREWAFR
jgi:hypothetical protein